MTFWSNVQTLTFDSLSASDVPRLGGSATGMLLLELLREPEAQSH